MSLEHRDRTSPAVSLERHRYHLGFSIHDLYDIADYVLRSHLISVIMLVLLLLSAQVSLVSMKDLPVLFIAWRCSNLSTNKHMSNSQIGGSAILTLHALQITVHHVFAALF